jgi:DNA-binding XRE family transcriptional regulator
MQSESARRLEKWLVDSDTTQTELAKKLGTTRQAVSSWCVGRVMPGLFYALAIEELTGGAVELEQWLSSERQAQLESLRVAP